MEDQEQRGTGFEGDSFVGSDEMIEPMVEDVGESSTEREEMMSCSKSEGEKEEEKRERPTVGIDDQKRELVIVLVIAKEGGAIILRSPASEKHREEVVGVEKDGKAEEEIQSIWVLQNIQRISNMLGVTFEGIEDQMMVLFVAIE